MIYCNSVKIMCHLYLELVHTDQFVQACGDHHLSQYGHHSDGMTMTLIDPHQFSCLGIQRQRSE